MREKFTNLLRIFIPFVLFLLVIPYVSAQEITVNGQVVDRKGEPIVGANVVIKGTSASAITDLDGNFVLQAMPGDKIEVKFIGYEAVVKKVRPMMHIKMSEFKRWHWSVYGGVNVNNLFYETSYVFDEPKLGGQLGIGLEYALSKRWSIQTLLGVYNKRFQTSYIYHLSVPEYPEWEEPYPEQRVGPDFEEDVHLADAWMADLALLFSYRIKINDKLNISVGLGANAGYVFDGDLTVTTRGATNTKKTYDLFIDEYDSTSGLIQGIDKGYFDLIGAITVEYNRVFVRTSIGYGFHDTSCLNIGYRF